MVSSHVDIDECALGISGCEQQCTNTNGSYYCTCRNGFSLQNDSKSCCTFTCAIDIDECINETLTCPILVIMIKVLIPMEVM